MFEDIKAIIIDVLRFEGEVTPESDLFEDLQADSLDAVELAMAIEEECGVEIPDEELSNMKTVKDIVDYVEANK